MMSEVTVCVANWQRDEAIRAIRQAVFIDEQGVPPDLEWDAEDADATHFLLLRHQTPLGTARLLADGRIGRMAILTNERQKGFGRELMLAIMLHARKLGISKLSLSAQTHALGFYRQLGFEASSAVYLEAGIPHQTMCWASQHTT